MWYYLAALIVFGLDRITKRLIENNLKLYEQIHVIGNFFLITSHRNRGAAFGILQNQRWFFIVFTILVVAVVIWYLQRMITHSRKRLAFALSLILGGAAGNFLDRAVSGEVVDFLQFNFRFTLFGKPIDYTYPIFNVADSFIFIGVVIILVDQLLAWKEEKRGSENNDLVQS